MRRSARCLSDYDNVRVFDWNAITNNRPHLFWSDGFHVNPKGCAAYAKSLDKIARLVASRIRTRAADRRRCRSDGLSHARR